ncbi:MAG TPA: DedA family protein [Candidatus Paceibacterota bacterium]|nr:DedA family protein [Candidatus Paceibacterota bacterium]
MTILLANIVGIISASRYGLLFFTTLLGSPVVMIGAGYLIHIHQLDFWPAYATIVAADIVGDIGWYWVGRRGARPFLEKYGSYMGITDDVICRLEERFKNYHEWILIISKLTMGFGVAIGVLAVAGMMRVPFGRYLAINLSGELLWALIPIGIGYYFGNISDLFPPSLRYGFVAFGFVIMIFAMRYALKKLAAREW